MVGLRPTSTWLKVKMYFFLNISLSGSYPWKCLDMRKGWYLVLLPLPPHPYIWLLFNIHLNQYFTGIYDVPCTVLSLVVECIFIYFYPFIRLCWVPAKTAGSSIFVVACEIFSCGLWDLLIVPWQGNGTQASCTGIPERSKWTTRVSERLEMSCGQSLFRSAWIKPRGLLLPHLFSFPPDLQSPVHEASLRAAHGQSTREGHADVKRDKP